MQVLNSKNYVSVQVYIRGMDEPLNMSPASGTRLMQYLTAGAKDQSSHVMLTDVDGVQLVVNRREIVRVDPVERNPKVTYTAGW